jgi:hypothetical protein
MVRDLDKEFEEFRLELVNKVAQKNAEQIDDMIKNIG